MPTTNSNSNTLAARTREQLAAQHGRRLAARAVACVLGSLILFAPVANAQSQTEDEGPPPFTLSAYAEAYYSYNLNRPGNGITAYRGFDSRHNSFVISNAVVDAQWDTHNVVGRVALQVGTTPDTYYLAEPGIASGGGIAASDSSMRKYVQQAFVGYRFGSAEHPLLVTGGLFLSPIGPESIAVRDNWTWSRSTLFFGLPFYHVGARASLQLTPTWTTTLGVYNGWNNVVDNNAEKSIQTQLTYNGTPLTLTVLYMLGVERNRDASEGRAWRHLFDAYAQWTVNERVSLLVHGDVGFEPNAFGTSTWAAAALYGRVMIVDGLFATLRVDALYERAAANSVGTANAIFFPATWVSSGTLTLDARPAEHVSFRLEYRHDHAASDMYFGGAVLGDGSTMPFLANRRAQNTVTLGATTWF